MALKKRNKVSAEFSMSSLTDIIFLLLIFFMLTSTLVSQNALNLKLPSSSSKTVAPQSLSVSIQKGGKFFVDGKRVKSSALTAAIRKGIRNQSKKDGKPTVNILAEQGVGIEHVVRVMDVCNKLKLNAILLTEPN